MPRPLPRMWLVWSFVAAFAPDEGEQLGEVASALKDSILGPAQIPLRYPTGQGTGDRC